MAKQKHGLGRGLDALLETTSPSAPVPEGAAGLTVDPALLLPNPRQPRREFNEEALQELADSIISSSRVRGVQGPHVSPDFRKYRL